MATAAAALDRFSEGRLTLGVGLGGVSREFEAFGEAGDPKVRAEKLDEGLALINQLQSGRRVDHHGPHYVADGVSPAPLPRQQPRPPIWVGGSSTGALRRAARWDGYTAGTIADEHGRTTLEPAELRRRLDVVARTDDAFDVAVIGESDPGDSRFRDRYAEAGVTWWLECIHDLRGSLGSMIERVRRGP